MALIWLGVFAVVVLVITFVAVVRDRENRIMLDEEDRTNG